MSRVRSSSRASGTSAVYCTLILGRIDALLKCHGLSGLINQHWPTRAALRQLPLALAIYKTIGHLLSHRGDSLALTTDDQTGENGEDGGPDESGEQEEDLAGRVDSGGAEEDDGQEGPMASDDCQDALIGDGDGQAAGGGQPTEPDDDDHSEESDDHHNYLHKVGDVRFRILPAYEAPGTTPTTQTTRPSRRTPLTAFGIATRHPRSS
ncbi:unnamed protein product [Vitrella brassicaformis CCMP3155]|uniref:Uncharacterized protein n=1 Tax=Vitrella brassicaformis (strain CCMP3155) TaxID=1169540 RepID=A0A0G4EPQ6_VITBC|nr:unnamed protein product [Vitrella brassicaformis CCMP3155]|eukprot:CEL99245.1 unnamed protein product [Vitrella brassicaformis CCMP3155]